MFFQQPGYNFPTPSAATRASCIPTGESLLGLRKDRGGIDLECTFQPRLTSRCPEPIRIKLAADGHDERGTRRLENMYNAGREFQVLCVPMDDQKKGGFRNPVCATASDGVLVCEFRTKITPLPIVPFPSFS